jgi:hypothetical protein
MLKQTIWKTTCAPKTSRFGRLITDWLVENTVGLFQKCVVHCYVFIEGVFQIKNK